MVPEVRASPSWLASWAPPETRLGALQRGRGDGFRMALSGGLEAAAEVVGCVLDDPRWDRQVESRDSYYARLLLALGGDLGPIAARLAALAEDVSNDSANLWLPLGVTSELAARGHVGAVEILADLVASTRLWESCLDALEGAGGPRLVGEVVSPEIAAALVARLGPAELREAVNRVGAPWATWAETIPDLRPALAEFSPTRAIGRGESPAPSGSIDRSLSVDALLRMDLPPRNMRELAALVGERRDVATTSALLRVAMAVGHPSRVMALQLLGRRGYVELLGDAAAFLRDEVNGRGDPRLRRGYLLYLQELPAAAVLPLARAWLRPGSP